MLLGHLPLAEAVECGEVHVSTRLAFVTAAALFPPLPIWYPPWEELPASV